MPSLNHPLWASLKFSIIIISSFFLVLHLFRYISLSLKSALKKQTSSERLGSDETHNVHFTKSITSGIGNNNNWNIHGER